MANNFLKAKSYCDKCPLELEIKKGNLKRSSERNEYQCISDMENPINVDILFLTDCVEHSDDLLKLERLIKKLITRQQNRMPKGSTRASASASPSLTKLL